MAATNEEIQTFHFDLEINTSEEYELFINVDQEIILEI